MLEKSVSFINCENPKNRNLPLALQSISLNLPQIEKNWFLQNHICHRDIKCIKLFPELFCIQSWKNLKRLTYDINQEKRFANYLKFFVSQGHKKLLGKIFIRYLYDILNSYSLHYQVKLIFVSSWNPHIRVSRIHQPHNELDID